MSIAHSLPTFTISLCLGASHVFNTAAPCLAEFYILFEPEPSRKAHRPGWDAGADSGQHLAQLIRSYEAEDAAAGSDAQDAGWSGEGYEEDAARGADAAYLKFAKQLALVPQQCIRYYDRWVLSSHRALCSSTLIDNICVSSICLIVNAQKRWDRIAAGAVASTALPRAGCMSTLWCSTCGRGAAHGAIDSHAA